MGACTVTITDNTVWGNKRVVYGTIAGSSSYAQGGETFTLAQLGLNALDDMSIRNGFTGSAPAASYEPTIDFTNRKVLFFGGAAAGVAAQDAAGAANVSQSNRFQAIGV